MIGETRLRLKQPTGWFAAGREVACALELLSDATFKLFVWLCLHAERSRGTVSATPSQLARVLGKKETNIEVALEELQRQGVCNRDAEGVIQINDRFWPYQRQCDPSPRDESQDYVAEVKRMFLSRRCIQSSFTAADEKLAMSLYRRKVPLSDVEHAILLGAARKYASLLQNGRGTPISSLHYFMDLFEEVRQEISPQYWMYIAHQVQTFEQQWTGFHSRRADTNDASENDKRGDTVGRPSC
jgi:hypothetical protein